MNPLTSGGREATLYLLQKLRGTTQVVETAAAELQTLWSQPGSALHRNLCRRPCQTPVSPHPRHGEAWVGCWEGGAYNTGPGELRATCLLILIQCACCTKHTVHTLPTYCTRCTQHIRAHNTYVHTHHAHTMHTMCIYHMPSTTTHIRHTHSHMPGTYYT